MFQDLFYDFSGGGEKKNHWSLLYTSDQFLSRDSIFEHSKIWQGLLAICV